MKVGRRFVAENRAEWRDWLARHHDSHTEIWLVYNKKASGRPRVPYADAVEEALCFGWIDGITKSIDDKQYAQRFTPRREKSNWSELNRRRFAKLVEDGRMTPAGAARGPKSAVAGRQTSGATVPAYIRKALGKNLAAKRFFDELAPSYRRLYVRWIDSAKKEETRERRLQEAISLLARKHKPGLK